MSLEKKFLVNEMAVFFLLPTSKPIFPEVELERDIIPINLPIMFEKNPRKIIDRA